MEECSCGWAAYNEKMQAYHDTEWGVPVHDDRKMFEHLSLEVLQCGLNWNMMLQKREIFRRCFADFDFWRIASFGEEDMARILRTEGMIRSPRKVRAILRNAACSVDICRESGSLCDFFWSFTDGKTILYQGHDQGRIPVSNALSEKISGELKKRGFSYVGPVTVYSHLQACGMINDHGRDCPCYRRLTSMYPSVPMERRGEKGI